MHSILAIDISKTGCGWSFGLPSEVPIGGVESFGDADATPDEVFLRGGNWIGRQIVTLNPAEVALEAAIVTSGGGFTNPQTNELLIGLQSVFRFIVKAKLPGRAHLIASSTARKTMTGRGTYATGEAKPAVQAECLRRGWLTLETMEENRADALAVWCARAAIQLPELAFSQPKRTRAVRE